MPAEIIHQRTPDEVALRERREELARLRVSLAEAEEELAQLRAQLKAFESRYFRQVGVLYAQLDELEARVREREADLYDSDEARARATEARERAQQSHDAAVEEEARQQQEFQPPATLKAIFREVARRIHPDYASDAAEAKYFTLLMARANAAYRRGDAEVLLRLLDDQRDIQDASFGDELSAQTERVMRQMQHARRDIALVEEEHALLLQSDIAHLHADAEAAAQQHRDLLTELAARVREQISEAEYRFNFVNRQVSAYGR